MSAYLAGELAASGGRERLGHVAHLSVWSLAPKLLVGAALLVAALAAFALWPSGSAADPAPRVVTAALALLGLIPLASALVTFYTTEIGVTDRRVLYKVGLVRRRTFEMVLEKVESLWIEQSVPGRLLGYGTIRVAAASEENIVIASVAEPFVLKREIDEAKGRRLGRAPTLAPASTAPEVFP